MQKYRADIDGLRAVAVLPVVFFHAGSRVFRGGFVGVDVFFVISGFLITGLILPEIQNGSFSIARFYERRVRRIFPALFSVLLVCALIAAAVLTPDDLVAFGSSLVATTFFASNLFFYHQSGYFDAPAEQKPLLHTWSLAVEEQFYIVFPLFLLAVRKYGRGRFVPWSAAVVVGTFLLSAWGVAHDRSAAFYLAPARAWELGLGALLAMGAVPAPRRAGHRHAAGIVGLAMVLLSTVLFSSQTPFPGMAAVLPCAGTALVIWAGMGGRSLVGRVLQARPLVLVGLVSYSLYLWHWPLLVFARYVAIRNLDFTETAVVVALSAAAAIASWRFIERPFRGRHGVLGRSRLFATAGLTMACAAGLGAVGYASHGLPERFGSPPPRPVIGSLRSDPVSGPCLETSVEAVTAGRPCRVGDLDPRRVETFFAWGDSHLRALAGGLAVAAARHGVAGGAAMHSGCAPLVDVWRASQESKWKCEPFNDAVLRLIAASPDVRDVLLVSRWAFSAEGVRYRHEDGDPMFLEDEQSAEVSLLQDKNVFRRGLERTVDALDALHKRVWILASVPEVGWDVPSVLARALFWKRLVRIAPTVEEYRARQRDVLQALARLQTTGRATVLYPGAILCHDDTCDVMRNGHVLYSDDDHLSPFGAHLLVPLFEQMFVGTDDAGAMDR